MSESYIPIDDFRNKDFDISSAPIRNYKTGKNRYELSVFPNEIDFGLVLFNTTSLVKTALLINTGYDDVTINNVEAVGNFIVESPSSPILRVGEMLNLNIRFNPNSINNFTGAVTISSDDTVGDKVIKLIGIGAEFTVDNSSLTAALAAIWPSLPTELPSTPGQPWNNSGELAFS